MLEPIVRLWRLASLIGREQRDKLFGKRFKPWNRPWMRYREIDVIRRATREPTAEVVPGMGRRTQHTLFPSHGAGGRVMDCD